MEPEALPKARGTRILIASVAAVAGVFLLLGLILSQQAVQSLITMRALNLLAGAGQEIAVQDVDGRWPSEIILTNVTGRDSGGVWLTIDRMALRWRPMALLRGRVVVDDVAAGAVGLPRLPERADRVAPPQPVDLAAIFAALGKIEIGQVSVGALSLGRPVFGEPMVLTMTGRLRDAKTHVEVRRTDGTGRAVLDVETAQGGARLQLDAQIGALSATGDVTMANGEQLSGMLRIARAADPDRAHIDVRVSGTRRAPAVDADFAWSDLTVEGRMIGALRGTLRAVPAAASGAYDVSGAGAVTDLKQFMPEAATFVSSEASWSLDVTQATLRGGRLNALRIAAGDSTLEIAGAFTDDEVTSGRAVLTVRGLGRIAGMAEDESATQLSVGIERLTRAGVGAGTVTLAIDKLRKVPPLRATARWSADPQALSVSQIGGSTADLRISGQSNWTRGSEGIDHRETSLDIAVAPRVLGFEAGEDLRIGARLNGALAALQATFTARSEQLGAPVLGMSGLDASLTASRDRAAIEATLGVSATWRGAPLTLAADLHKGQDALLRIAGLRAQSLAGSAEGAATVQTDSGLAEGEISANLPDVSLLATTFGAEVTGALDAKITLSHAGGQQRARAAIALARLISSPLRVGRVDITAEIADAWGARDFDARLATTAGLFLGSPVRAVTASAQGTAAAFSVALKAAPAGRAPFGLDAAADVTVGEPTTVRISRFNLEDGFKVALADVATIRIGRELISADKIALAVAGGTVTSAIEIDRIKNSVAGTMDASGISMRDFVPDGYAVPAGTGAGRVVIGGAIGDATIEANLGADFPADRRAATPAFRLNARASARDGRLDLDVRVDGFSPQPATLALDMPFRLDLGGPRILVEDSAPLAAAVSWHGSIAPLWRLLPTDRHLLSGDIALDAAVSGTLAAPQIKGMLHVADGAYENIPGGTVLRGVELNVSTEAGDDLRFTGSARDGGAGKAQFSGQLTRNAAGAWTADLTGALDRLTLLERDDVIGSASGTITYTGPLLGGVIKGNLAVVRGAINLDATGVPEVPLLRSWEFSRAASGAPPPPVPPVPIRFDLSLSMADSLRVEGRGLESAWRGDLYISGTLAKPDVSGTVGVERGTFTFLGQSFELESGSVTFTGGGRIDPQLSVTAVREVADITATVQITGPSSAPTVSLSSRPALPQDEVLARLLFNRGAGELGPLESIQLASAAADMSGVARGGISGIARRTFGLDTFSFGGQSGSAVVVGRQISRNIFVSVEQSVNSTNRMFIISWRLSRHFSLRSSANDETGANIGAFWRKDY